MISSLVWRCRGLWRALFSIALAIAATAALLWADPTGGNAAELFRYPVQLNVQAFLATLVANLVALLVARLMRSAGWHPRTGTRRLWLSVMATPLFVIAASLAMSAFRPAAPTTAEGVDGLPFLVGRDAGWMAIWGTAWLVWLTWAFLDSLEAGRRHREFVDSVLRSPKTRRISGSGADAAFGRIVVPVKRADFQATFQLEFSVLRELYETCCLDLGIGTGAAPLLVVSDAPNVNRRAPLYTTTRNVGPMIVLPCRLGAFAEQTTELAIKHLQAHARDSAGSEFDPRPWLVDGLRAILLHELAHHVSREGVVPYLAATVRAIFPVAWFVINPPEWRWLPWGAYQRFLLAAENACDADVISRGDVPRWLLEAAICSMHDVQSNARRAEVQRLQALLETLATAGLTGTHDEPLSERLRVLRGFPEQIRSGSAFVPAMFVVGLAAYFAPPATWQMAVSLPSSLPYQRIVPHAEIRSLGLTRTPQLVSSRGLHVSELFRASASADSARIYQQSALQRSFSPDNTGWQQGPINRTSQLTQPDVHSLLPGQIEGMGPPWDPLRRSNPTSPQPRFGQTSSSPFTHNPAASYGGHQVPTQSNPTSRNHSSPTTSPFPVGRPNR